VLARSEAGPYCWRSTLIGASSARALLQRLRILDESVAALDPKILEGMLQGVKWLADRRERAVVV
jgi:ABC-type thiamine transport system ATPase subunit